MLLRRLSAVLPCLCLSALLNLAPAATSEPLGSPWVLVRTDGGVEIGCRLPELTPAERNDIRLEQAGADLPVVAEWQETLPPTNEPPQRSVPRAGRIVRFTVPVTTLGKGPLTLRCASVRRPVAIRQPPPASAIAPVRLLIAGAANWPDRAALTRMGTALGGAVDAVIAIGERVDHVLGDGGWEDTTPIVVLGSGTPDTADALRPAVCWPHGCTWGLVGLPAGSDADVLRAAMARDLSPWLVPIALETPWNPMVGMERGDVAALMPWLIPCRQFRVPTLVLVGSAAGWISDPLAPVKGRLTAVAGGTRLVSATPAGGPLATQPDVVALGLRQPAVLGFAATPDLLTMVVVPLANDQPPLRLDYPAQPSEGAPHRPSSGWGDDTAEAARAAALGPRDTTEQQAAADAGLARLAWLPAPVLNNLHLSNDDFARLSGSMDQPAQVLLLRRLACSETVLHDHLVPLNDRLPTSVRHDLVLRHAAHPLTIDERIWASAITSGSDADVLRAAIAACARTTDPTFAYLLQERLRQQAVGNLPLERDPLLQHHLLCVVLESPLLSPTPLRQIALKLRPKVDALSRGPIERFLARVGEKRPMP